MINSLEPGQLGQGYLLPGYAKAQLSNLLYSSSCCFPLKQRTERKIKRDVRLHYRRLPVIFGRCYLHDSYWLTNNNQTIYTRCLRLYHPFDFYQKDTYVSFVLNCLLGIKPIPMVPNKSYRLKLKKDLHLNIVWLNKDCLDLELEYVLSNEEMKKQVLKLFG